MKGAKLAYALDSRGRWILTSSSRDQASWDARTTDGLSAFTELVAGALVANAEADADGDGFVTMADVQRLVAAPLAERTGQDVTFEFQGSGDLVVALAPGYPVDVDQHRESWLRAASGAVAKAPAIPPPNETDDAFEPGPMTEPAESSPLPTDMAEWAANALEQGRDVALRRQLQASTRKASVRVESDDATGFLAELDGLTSLTATFLNFESAKWFDKGVDSLVSVYERGFDSQGFTKTNATAVGGRAPAELWLHLLDRILALGGLAVRLGDWTAVRTLALQRPDGYDFRYYSNWLRHALTEAARANLFRIQTDAGQVIDQSAIVRAQRVMGALRT